MFTKKVIEKREKGKEKSQESRTNNDGKLFSCILLLASCFYSLSSNAQCAMCRASLESTGNQGQAQAINNGIVYLMVIPYILVALIGFAIYRMFAKKK